MFAAAIRARFLGGLYPIWRNLMRLLRIGTLLAIVALPLLASARAMADPPPTNPNMSVSTWACTRGSETLGFQAVTITQNNAIALQLVGSTSVVHIVHVTVNGQVVLDIPGQSRRPDLWSCIASDVGPGVVLDVFLTPRG
jgi:hypothetical protein